jgi:flavin reductase (DIM6/NTAB) family NADH-FMN oxidoreductase RutF
VSMRLDLGELSATERYKLLAGLIVPRPIALVTTQSPDGRINAAPFSFFNVFAEEPPLVVLGLGISPLGGAKDTTANIRESGAFVINLVDEPIAEAMNLCAIDFPPEISEIEIAGLELSPSGAVAPPRIAQAPVNLECRRYLTLEVARERALVIGEVLVAHVRDGLIDPATLRVDRDAYAPIGRLFGGGYVRTRDRFEMPRLTYREWLDRARGSSSGR